MGAGGIPEAPDPESDEALMEKYRDGHLEAFDTLYHRHKGALFRYIKRQCAQPAVVDELFQDVWLALVRSRHRYSVRARFKTFLFHIAHNRIIDHYRSSMRRPSDPTDPQLMEKLAAATADAPDRRLQSQRDAQRLIAAIARLPPEQRDVFLLHQEAGLSLEEISLTTGVGRETVKSRLRYAFDKLRSGLAE